MLRRAAVLGIALPLLACTEHVIIHDMWGDGSAGPGADATPARDATGGFSANDAFCKYQYRPLAFTPRAAQLVFLLDRSVYMQSSFNGTPREIAAELALVDTVAAYQSKVKFGFEQFPPDSNDRAYTDCQRNTCCAGSVIVDPKPNASKAMNGPIECDQMGNPPCPTPGYDSASFAALAQVRDYFKSHPSGDDRYAVLVTASEPSCSSLSDGDACKDALAAANDLGNMGVGFAVVSVGYQPDPTTSCLVRIGNTGTLYTPLNSYALATDLDEFVSAVARTGCVLDSNDVPPPQTQLVVSMGTSTTAIPQVDSPDQNGWSFANSAHTSITFSGTWCDQFVGSQFNNISAGDYCSTCGGPSACPQWQ